jgi:phosphoenolpyruvate-protein kinase (PTS system EI component)
MIPSSILHVKSVIRQIRYSEGVKLAQMALKATTAADVREKLKPYQKLLSQGA